ncbi:helix-turn-helix domain-containing protein [Parapedobacter sp. ISTM3]|uniref:Helix-turn-helix domain-containing protein n=1 Tax=Parapedobacter luteus TaxID=623280 RepID=A0A1T5CIR3_9SPHI|nr:MULTISPECIES: helix-turn-helix domain-containing protein [Parapedobacter]MBK1439701.1 helix-turn-helix domain-containing protein [Parapedobacter sp. ISTM3]SKB59314.1 Helix-turn-helix domain-containing protein [Parapedobacter luteus]
MPRNPYLSAPSSFGGGLANEIVPLLHLLAELLKRLLAGLGNPAHRHGLLLPEEVCMMLRISDRTLRRHTEQGILKPLRIGGMRYYLMDDIIQSGRDGSVT